MEDTSLSEPRSHYQTLHATRTRMTGWHHLFDRRPAYASKSTTCQRPAPKHTLSWLKALSKLYRYITRLNFTVVTSSFARVSTISARAFNAVSKGEMAVSRTRKASRCHWSNGAYSVRVVMRKRFIEGAWEVESDRFDATKCPRCLPAVPTLADKLRIRDETSTNGYTRGNPRADKGVASRAAEPARFRFDIGPSALRRSPGPAP